MFVRNPALRATIDGDDDGRHAPRFANDGTRAVLERILDDLLRRIDERTIAADDAAAIVRSLRAFCCEPPSRPGLRSLRDLRDVLDPERFSSRARRLAESYARLATVRSAPAGS
jgi:hypothetical protein